MEKPAPDKRAGTGKLTTLAATLTALATAGATALATFAAPLATALVWISLARVSFARTFLTWIALSWIALSGLALTRIALTGIALTGIALPAFAAGSQIITHFSFLSNQRDWQLARQLTSELRGVRFVPFESWLRNEEEFCWLSVGDETDRNGKSS